MQNNTFRERRPEFPKGWGSDHMILRFLQPQYYLRMKIKLLDF